MSYLLNGVVSSRALAVIPAPADIIFLHEYEFASRVSQVRPNQIVGAARSTESLADPTA